MRRLLTTLVLICGVAGGFVGGAMISPAKLSLVIQAFKELSDKVKPQHVSSGNQLIAREGAARICVAELEGHRFVFSTEGGLVMIPEAEHLSVPSPVAVTGTTAAEPAPVATPPPVTPVVNPMPAPAPEGLGSGIAPLVRNRRVDDFGPTQRLSEVPAQNVGNQLPTQ